MEALGAHVIALARLSTAGEAGLKNELCESPVKYGVAKILRGELCGVGKLLPMATALGKFLCHHPACTQVTRGLLGG